jgi:hypothetical protein
MRHFLVLLLTLAAACQPAAKKERKWEPPYSFELPAGWGLERMEFPIEFAPDIKYKGVEDLRFAPGWGDANSPEHWSYAFLWWLEGDLPFNQQMFTKYLNEYYSGLVQRNVVSRKIPADKQMPVTVSIGDRGNDTYTGAISMLNYMTLQPIDLNCVIHVKHYKTNTAVFVEVSPQQQDHKVWTTMDRLVEGFKYPKAP